MKNDLVLVVRKLLPIAVEGDGCWGKLHLMLSPNSRSAACGCLTYPLEAAAIGECRYGLSARRVSVGECSKCVAALRMRYVRMLAILSFFRPVEIPPVLLAA